MTYAEAKALFDSTKPLGQTWHAHRDVLVNHPQFLEMNKAYWFELDRVWDDELAADAIRNNMDALGYAFMEREDLKAEWESWIKAQKERIHDEYEQHWAKLFEEACRQIKVTNWVHPWMSTHFGNGTKDRSGNPLFTAWSPKSLRGLRIITHNDSRVPPQMYVDIFGKGEPDAVEHLVLILCERPRGKYDDKFVALMGKWISGASKESIFSFWVDTLAARLSRDYVGSIEARSTCPTCAGSGKLSGDQIVFVDCVTCEGVGKVDV